MIIINVDYYKTRPKNSLEINFKTVYNNADSYEFPF